MATFVKSKNYFLYGGINIFLSWIIFFDLDAIDNHSIKALSSLSASCVKVKLMWHAIIFLLIISVSSSCLACSCVAPQVEAPREGAPALTKEQILSAHAAWYLRRANTVVRAKVMKSESIPNKVPFQRFEISVIEVIQGNAVQHMIALETGASNCSLHLNKGEEWLLFIQKTSELDICSGNTKLAPIKDQNDALAFLKAVRSSAP
jgi:hypothetical protein